VKLSLLTVVISEQIHYMDNSVNLEKKLNEDHRITAFPERSGQQRFIAFLNDWHATISCNQSN